MPQSPLYDIIVIGAGSAGLSIALPMHEFGFKVLLIDKSDHQIGGDCLNDGCVPSKSLIHVARQVYQANHSQEFGMNISGKVDMSKVWKYVKERQNIIRKHENAAFFRNMGIEVALGTASFVSADEIEVSGQVYKGKKIVIATGSRPKKLQIPGIEQVKWYDNQSIFAIDFLPDKLLVIGGGPIGVELGQAFSRLGSQVSIVHNKAHILDKEEPEITTILQERLLKEGITFHLQAEVLSFTNSNTVAVRQDDKQLSLTFDAVLVAAGRELNIESLQLSTAGIETENGNIKVNKYLQTTNKHVFVCGDVAGNLKFSHAAEQQATILLNNFLSPLKKPLDNKHMSWVTFTDPEVATFGYSLKELKDKKIAFEKLSLDFDEDDRAVVEDYQYGKLILYIEQKKLLNQNPKILGGTMIAPNAGELIQELILANSAGMGIEALFNKIYPYPTASAVNKRIILNKKREQLTPFVKKVLHTLYNI
ncbi:FAD-dependent oxidoreductase [Rhodocytophaga rosea]|uniref:FAD-dependent oxidoreductase n=1 Tax=Rhodocytophaga rosea TaxID=2704465 RepID=A0A6C0GSN4_9BACT|nr:FAD-dependent oxidoreductase [Rhodocytophaga rosea]QHT71151.1 FAD-dependent oxidoreductase [Rhodocytophaga rosea]